MEWLVLSLHWSCFNLSVIQCYHVKVIDSLFIPNMFALNCWLFRNQEFGPNWSIFHLILFLLQPKFLITPHEIFIHLVLFLFKSLSLFPDLSDCLFWSGLQTSVTLFFLSLQCTQEQTLTTTIGQWFQVVLYGIIHYFFKVLHNVTCLWHLFNMICWGNMFGYIFRKC